MRWIKEQICIRRWAKEQNWIALEAHSLWKLIGRDDLTASSHAIAVRHLNKLAGSAHMPLAEIEAMRWRLLQLEGAV